MSNQMYSAANAMVLIHCFRGASVAIRRNIAIIGLAPLGGEAAPALFVSAKFCSAKFAKSLFGPRLQTSNVVPCACCLHHYSLMLL
jgi:hypothetical protein